MSERGVKGSIPDPVTHLSYREAREIAYAVAERAHAYAEHQGLFSHCPLLICHEYRQMLAPFGPPEAVNPTPTQQCPVCGLDGIDISTWTDARRQFRCMCGTRWAGQPK